MGEAVSRGTQVVFEASEALYEEGGPLSGSEQPQRLELGTFEFVQLTYEGLRVGPEGEHIAFLVDGLWRLGVEHVPSGNGWTSFGPAPNGLVFSDVIIAEASEEGDDGVEEADASFIVKCDADAVVHERWQVVVPGEVIAQGEEAIEKYATARLREGSANHLDDEVDGEDNREVTSVERE
jgi:hypothetical protein